MPYIPNVVGNTALSADTLNAIGEDIGVGVVVAENNIQTLYEYGNVILANTSLMNKWYDGLVNKILRSRLIDTMYKNRLAPTFKGVLDIGEGIEEILVPPAAVQQQNQDKTTPRNPYGANLPEVYTKWHVINAEMQYGVRVSKKRLRRAFVSFDAMNNFAQYVTDSLFNGYEWDSQILTKFKAAQAALFRIEGNKAIAVASPVTSDGTAFLAAARADAELFRWMSDQYNDAGVPVATDNSDLYIIMPARVESHVDVKDLAAAFNLEYAQFLGRRMPVDSFTFSDREKARLMEIAGVDSWFFTAEQEAQLATVLGIVADIDLFQIYDAYEPDLWENPNGADAETNFWLHADKIVGLSPFANYQVYVAGEDEDAVATVTP